MCKLLKRTKLKKQQASYTDSPKWKEGCNPKCICCFVLFRIPTYVAENTLPLAKFYDKSHPELLFWYSCNDQHILCHLHCKTRGYNPKNEGAVPQHEAAGLPS